MMSFLTVKDARLGVYFTFSQKCERFFMDQIVAALTETQKAELIRRLHDMGGEVRQALLDTLFLASPLSWRGTLQQYAGRLHRLHNHKHKVIIYDYVDEQVPQLVGMFSKRLAGYRAMGYTVEEDGEVKGD
jgi:hypothetical protein